MAVSSTNSTGASGASIDVAAVVQQLMTFENRPLDAINAKITRQSTIISDLGTLKSKVSTFSDALAAFENPDSFNDTTVSTSNSSYVQASSANGTQLGNYSISVTSIASPSRYAFVGFTSEDDAVSNLTGFTITVGSGDTYTAADISADIGSTPTITELADWINDLGENVAANVVLQNTATNGDETWALTIQSTETGVENAVVLGTTTGIAAIGNTVEEAAANAVFNFNGVDFERASNTVSDVVEGLAVEIIDVTATIETGTFSFASTAGNDSQFTLNGLTLTTTAANNLSATQVAELFANGVATSGSGYILTGTAGSWVLDDSAANGTAIFTAASSGDVNALTASDVTPASLDISVTGFVDGDGSGTGVNAVQTVTFDSANGAAKRITFNGLTLITDATNVLDANAVATLFAGRAAGDVVNTSGTGYVLTGTVGAWETTGATATAGALEFTYEDDTGGLSQSTASTLTMDVNGTSSVITTAGAAISPINLRVKEGTDTSSTVIQTLVTSYNELMAYYKTLTAYGGNGSTSTTATFSSDPTLLSFISEIKSKFAQGASYGTDYAGGFSLSWAGIDMELDGTLSFDQTNYDAAISDGLLAILQEGVTVAYSATSDSLSTYLDSYAGTNGYIQDLILSKAEEAYSLSDQQAQIQTRLDKIETSLYTQYSALNALLFQLSSTSDSLTSALDALNNNNN